MMLHFWYYCNRRRKRMYRGYVVSGFKRGDVRRVKRIYWIELGTAHKLHSVLAMKPAGFVGRFAHSILLTGCKLLASP